MVNYLPLLLASVLAATQANAQARSLYNREAGVPPQCYTKTEGRFNPCYICHQDARPDSWNRLNDGEQQQLYNFSDVALHNHWTNLFEDRSVALAAISDDEIDRWVDFDNYAELLSVEEDGPGPHTALPRIRELGSAALAFDSEGLALDGSRWAALNFKPTPSTFWPTNGSFGDVFIRLPFQFSSLDGASYSRDVYLANLAILETAVKGLAEVSSSPVDESVVAIDLDGDGAFSIVQSVRRRATYVGAARDERAVERNFPTGTEFLHPVRYLSVTDEGRVLPARRMKEVRYMRKEYAMSKRQLEWHYEEERQEKDQGVVPVYPGSGKRGLRNMQGWILDGLIEDKQGRLRRTSYEEKLFCMGCHSGVGVTVDSTFSFVRKVDGRPGWSVIDLSTQRDVPTLGEEVGEFELYMARVGGGSEFRNNREMKQRWFDGDAVRAAGLRGLTLDQIIVPSPERARQLNKAYYQIVREGSYERGRDAAFEPVGNVYEKIEGTEPLMEERVSYQLQLDWRAEVP